MDRKCCVPNCKSGYKEVVKEPEVTFHNFKPEWKSRDRDRKVKDNTCICSKHFVSSDFISELRDTNKIRRTKKATTKLKYQFLKNDAYPTVFPNCPPYLSQKNPLERSPWASSAAQEELSQKQKEEKRQCDLQLDKVLSLSDINNKQKSKEFVNLLNTTFQSFHSSRGSKNIIFRY